MIFLQKYLLAGCLKICRIFALPLPFGRVQERLQTVGAGLRRLKIDVIGEEYIHSRAESLTKIKWYEVEQPVAVPHIDGKNVGKGRKVDVVWDLDSDTLYVKRLPRPMLANCVPQVIGGMFNRKDIQNVLYYSFERRPQDIREYLENNFRLSEDGDEGSVPSPKHEPESTRTSTHTEQASNTPTDNDGEASTPEPRFKSRHTSTHAKQNNIITTNSNDSESAADRKKVECKGIELVIECEKQRNPNSDIKDVSADKCGYDIKSSDRYIEVKSFKTTGSPSLTENEWNFAKNNSSKCWLYVVENIFDDDMSLEEKIIRIENLGDKQVEVATVTYKFQNWNKVRKEAKLGLHCNT